MGVNSRNRAEERIIIHALRIFHQNHQANKLCNELTANDSPQKFRSESSAIRVGLPDVAVVSAAVDSDGLPDDDDDEVVVAVDSDGLPDVDDSIDGSDGLPDDDSDDGDNGE